MPLLKEEPYAHPPDLFSEERFALWSSEAWWVLHTKPRTEKKLARTCLEKNLHYFLPQYTQRRQGRGRIRTSYLPLFPGYLFLQGSAIERLAALKTNLVLRTLEVPDQEAMRQDLMRVHQLMHCGTPLTPEGLIVQGTPVEIMSGPLCGLKGIVLRQGRKERFYVSVRFLQRGVAAEVDGWNLKPLGKPGELPT